MCYGQQKRKSSKSSSSFNSRIFRKKRYYSELLSQIIPGEASPWYFPEKTPSYSLRRIPTFHDHTQGRERGDNLITVIEAEGLSIAHFGDIGHLLSGEQLDALGAVDIMMLPVGGYYTVGAEEAKKIADAVGASVVIPMHYRGKGFGYDVLDSVDSFLALYPKEEICTLPSPEWEFTNELSKAVVVFG